MTAATRLGMRWERRESDWSMVAWCDGGGLEVSQIGRPLLHRGIGRIRGFGMGKFEAASSCSMTLSDLREALLVHLSLVLLLTPSIAPLVASVTR